MLERRARVLIVDDAVVVRSLLSRMLSEDPQIEVVGTSANGRLALRRLTKKDVDLVILDIDMPELDGLATLRIIRRDYPHVRVIMFSTLTEAGAAATVESLALGAHDYVTKPSANGATEQSKNSVRDELLRKIKAACFGEVLRSTSGLQRPAVPSAVPPLFGPIEIVAIGASTGGPNALAQLLSELPQDFPVPIAIVQHMPVMFTKIFAERLDGVCHLSVREAVEGGAVTPGTVWLAAGGEHMVLVRKEQQVLVHVNQDPPVNFCRPAVDVLFASVANMYGARTLGVILTGMGQDGLRGCDLIHAAGGKILAQDQETSVVWGMPGYVTRANLAHEVLPLAAISQAIVRSVLRSRGQAGPAERPRAGLESSNG